MKRRVLLLALAVALPLALVVPLRAMRSWQPRVLELPRNSNVAASSGDLQNFTWRSNGLLMARLYSDAWIDPLTVNNWNGEVVTVRSLRAYEASVSRNGKLAALFYAANEHRIYDLWDVNTDVSRQSVMDLMRASQPENRMKWRSLHWQISPDGKTVAWDDAHINGLQLASTESGDLKARFVTPFAASRRGKFNAFAFSPNSRQLAVVGNGDIWIVDANSGRALRSWKNPFSGTVGHMNVAWSPDGKKLAISHGHDNLWTFHRSYRAAFLWVQDARTGQNLHSWSQSNQSLSSSAGGITVAEFSPGSQTLAFGTFDGDAHLMNLQTGKIERHFPTPNAQALTNAAHYVAFSPDGQTLAVATQNKILLWRVK